MSGHMHKEVGPAFDMYFDFYASGAALRSMHSMQATGVRTHRARACLADPCRIDAVGCVDPVEACAGYNSAAD